MTDWNLAANKIRDELVDSDEVIAGKELKGKDKIELCQSQQG